MSNSKERVQGFKLRLERIPRQADRWDVTKAVARALHSEDFPVKLSDNRLLNFKVELDESKSSAMAHDGAGYILLGDESNTRKVLGFFKDYPLRIQGQKIRVFIDGKVPHAEALELQRTPYTDPNIEQEVAVIDRELREELRINVLQFGALYTQAYPVHPDQSPQARSFSVEWEKDFREKSAAWLKFEYTHKLIRIVVSRLFQSFDKSTLISIGNLSLAIEQPKKTALR